MRSLKLAIAGTAAALLGLAAVTTATAAAAIPAQTGSHSAAATSTHPGWAQPDQGWWGTMW